MRKEARFSIVLLMVIFFSAGSIAQPIRGLRKGRELIRRSPARILWILKAKQKDFNITEDQLGKIQNLVFSFEERMIKTRSQNSLERLNLRKLLQDRENLDYEKIKAVLEKMANNRQNMFIERLKLRKEIENILTPEQREALRSALKERMKRRAFAPRRESSPLLPGRRGRIRQ